ncbi:carboxypeptidase-like regulatory domain-containing protein, partial [Sphingobacterium mizutaii]|uniref:carboxypeptidase-like regulatory domain-containing protein n=2 Tax=Sphingobacterium TaxID=28453 RepID=UPI00289C9646
MKTIVILSLLFFTSIDVWAQYRVHGKIINEKEQTITGATIEVIGSDKRTLSDSNGMFSLAVSSDKGKIAVRHFGYENQVLIFDVERPEILV